VSHSLPNGISLIILSLMRILQRNLKRTTDTHYRHTLQTHTTDTHYRHILQTHTTDTHYRHIPFHFSLNERTPAISSLVIELLKKCRVR